MTSQIESLRRILPMVALLAVGACGASGPAAEGSPRGSRASEVEPFSGERAWAHLLALAGLGPRPSGSPAAQAAFEYLRTRLEESAGMEVVELALGEEAAGPSTAEGDTAAGENPGTRPARHLLARIPGDTSDRILLMAHYDTAPGTPGANDGASGVAVLLELARQLAVRPLHYTVEIVFLDDEMGIDGEPSVLPRLRGSRLLVERLARDGILDTVRLAVALRQVGDAELSIGRDLLSDRIHRESFFEAAADLGLGAAFPTDRGFVELMASHRPFWEAGMRRVVGLMDPWYGGDEPPGVHWGGEADTAEQCSEDSLETVGRVTLTALRRISDRLEKIDRLSGRAARRRAESAEPAASRAQVLPDGPPDPGAGAAEPEEQGNEPEEGEDPPGEQEHEPQEQGDEPAAPGPESS